MKNHNKTKYFKLACAIFILSVIILVSNSLFYCIASERMPEVEKIRRKAMSRAEKAMKIPDAKNGWIQYEKAVKGFKEIKGVDIIAIVNQGIKPGNEKSVAKLLNKNKEVIKLVDAGFRKPGFQIHINYSDGPFAPVPEFKKMRKLGYFLVLAGDYNLKKGNYSKAAQRYLQCLKLGEGTMRNGNLIFGLMGVATEKVALQHIQAMLNNYDLPKKEYKYLTNKLQNLNREHTTFPELFDNEMLFAEATYDLARDGKIKDLKIFTRDKILFKKDRRSYEKWYLASRKAILQDYPSARRSLSEIKIPTEGKIATTLIPACGKALDKFTLPRAKFAGVEILSAIKWYKKEKDDYPDNLRDLVPNYIRKIPKDPFSPDGSFVYVKKGEKILLYSVGPDGTDDSGKYDLQKFPNTGDIVFTAK